MSTVTWLGHSLLIVLKYIINGAVVFVRLLARAISAATLQWHCNKCPCTKFFIHKCPLPSTLQTAVMPCHQGGGLPWRLADHASQTLYTQLRASLVAQAMETSPPIPHLCPRVTLCFCLYWIGLSMYVVTSNYLYSLLFRACRWRSEREFHRDWRSVDGKRQHITGWRALSEIHRIKMG